MIKRLLLGVAASAAVSLAGRRAGALTNGGAVAAMAVGTAVVAGTSWRGATLLGTFFVTSSALSRVSSGAEKVAAAKDARRDAEQVMANGGVAALSALGALVWSRERAVAALAGALSAATADTWATEIGATSTRRPRLLVSGRETMPGVSGGVTARGTVASLAGAALLGAVSTLGAPRDRARLALATAAAGVTGSLVDSLAGELLQERRRCPVCGATTEARVHCDGMRTAIVAGLSGFDNDMVNAVATLVGALVGTALVGRTSSPPSTRG